MFEKKYSPYYAVVSCIFTSLSTYSAIYDNNFLSFLFLGIFIGSVSPVFFNTPFFKATNLKEALKRVWLVSLVLFSLISTYTILTYTVLANVERVNYKDHKVLPFIFGILISSGLLFIIFKYKDDNQNKRVKIQCKK